MTLVERWATAELATAELATVELQLNYKLNSSLKLRKLYVTYIRIQIILKIKYIVDIVHSTEKHQHPKKYKINSWAEASWHIFAPCLPEAAGVGFPKMNLGRFSNQKRVSNKKKVFSNQKRVSNPYFRAGQQTKKGQPYYMPNMLYSIFQYYEYKHNKKIHTIGSTQ